MKIKLIRRSKLYGPQTSASSYSRLGNRLGDLEQLFYSGQTKKHQECFLKVRNEEAKILG